MFRLAVYFAAEPDEAEELQDRVADVMRAHTLASSEPRDLGYVVALAEVEEPEDDDAFIALVTEGAHRILLGPAELLDRAEE